MVNTSYSKTQHSIVKERCKVWQPQVLNTTTLERLSNDLGLLSAAGLRRCSYECAHKCGGRRLFRRYIAWGDGVWGLKE